MAKNIKGPAIFLAQFTGDAAPFNSWDAICKWAASLGYKGVQIPSWDGRIFDLKKAAASKTYCDEIKGKAKAHKISITELSTHIQGQLVAVNPAFDDAFDAFAPKEVHGKPKERQKWAVEQVKLAAKASRNLGLNSHVSFTGALVWPFVYPWPPRPPGLIEEGFDELARRWKPLARCLRRPRRRCRLRIASRRRRDGWRDVRDVPRSPQGPQALPDQLRSLAFRACSSSTISTSSTSITSASAPFM